MYEENFSPSRFSERPPTEPALRVARRMMDIKSSVPMEHRIRWIVRTAMYWPAVLERVRKDATAQRKSELKSAANAQKKKALQDKRRAETPAERGQRRAARKVADAARVARRQAATAEAHTASAGVA